MKNRLLENAEEADQSIFIKVIQAGQPRPYADSIYEYEITFTGKNISTKPESSVLVIGNSMHRLRALKYIKALCHDFKMPDDPTRTLGDPVLRKCDKIEQTAWGSVWHVRIELVYLD